MADSVHVIEHRLLVASFSPQRRLVTDLFKVDNSYIHQVSIGLLIGSVALLKQLLSLCTSSCTAKELVPLL
jgi:hypothetical protein